MSDWMRPLIAGFAIACLIAIALWLALSPAHAEWRPEYAQADPATREWYRRAELTEAAQKRFGFKSCCAQSDRVMTRFRPTIEGTDGWEYLDGMTWRRVPNDIIHTDPAPGGEPIMFAVAGRPTCFFPPEGGI